MPRRCQLCRAGRWGPPPLLLLLLLLTRHHDSTRTTNTTTTVTTITTTTAAANDDDTMRAFCSSDGGSVRSGRARTCQGPGGRVTNKT